MAENPKIVTQPHLGKIKDNVKPHINMGGFLAMAKVMRVHHKHATADVEVINTRDVVSSDPTHEGKYAARIMSSYAHYDDNLMMSSGTIEPIQEGSIVLLAFLDGNKSRPIILGTMHYPDSTDKNILPMQYPIDPEQGTEQRKEALKYLKVFPSQMYHRVDGEGGVEISHPSRTFLKVSSDVYEEIDDSHGGYDHDDLKEKDPVTHETRYGHTEASLLPVKFLFTHRTSFLNDLTKWLKIFISRTGLFRITRDNNDSKLSYVEMVDDGTIRMRRQIDSNVHGQGNASEVTILPTGEMDFKHHTGSVIQFTEDGDIIIQANRYVKINQNG